MDSIEDRGSSGDVSSVDQSGLLIYGLIILINLFLILSYFILDKPLLYATQILSSIEHLIPGCFTSWPNASLEYKEVLFVAAPQSFFFSLLLVVVVLLRSLSKPGFRPRKLYKAGPVEGLLIGLGLWWIWYCWMGSSFPISSYDDLGFVSRRLFSSPIGIVIVALSPNFLSLEIGMDIRKLTSSRLK